MNVLYLNVLPKRSKEMEGTNTTITVTHRNSNHKDMQEDTEYVPDEEYKYRWEVGMAGELIIYRIKQHRVLAAATISDMVWTVWAPGTWYKVVDEE